MKIICEGKYTSVVYNDLIYYRFESDSNSDNAEWKVVTPDGLVPVDCDYWEDLNHYYWEEYWNLNND